MRFVAIWIQTRWSKHKEGVQENSDNLMNQKSTLCPSSHATKTLGTRSNIAKGSHVYCGDPRTIVTMTRIRRKAIIAHLSEALTEVTNRRPICLIRKAKSKAKAKAKANEWFLSLNSHSLNCFAALHSFLINLQNHEMSAAFCLCHCQ